jgi:hypothetical protein
VLFINNITVLFNNKITDNILYYSPSADSRSTLSTTFLVSSMASKTASLSVVHLQGIAMGSILGLFCMRVILSFSYLQSCFFLLLPIATSMIIIAEHRSLGPIVDRVYVHIYYTLCLSCIPLCNDSRHIPIYFPFYQNRQFDVIAKSHRPS